ncbi:MAG TPA: hypothetical protein VHN14_25705, partial [Kofleriaceae bacterium]|nr:hypothetical protein [Kofleriaceae bacterium]
GLFMGALGRARTFIVHSRTNPPVLPSDLAGITPATYEDRDNLDAALGPVCTKIRRAIESQGARQKAPDAEVKDASDPRISTLHQMLTEQNLMLTKLFQLTATQSKIHADPADSLDFLEGAWISSHNNHAYCKMIHGRPYFVYCWGGDSDATGEYYEFRRIDNDIVGRFRWFEGGIRGFVWLKIEHVDLLTGAWWMERDVPGLAYNDPELLKKAKGMNSYSWTRKATAAFPAWATAVFDRVK